jgi:hypothetical protein
MVYVAAFVFGFCSGAKSLADVGRLEADASCMRRAAPWRALRLV